MPANGLSVERLQEYLQQLPPESRTLLIQRLEAAGAGPIPGGEVLLQELRSVLRQSSDNAARGDTAVRYFFRPVEPFLADVDPTQTARPHRAGLARSPLDLDLPRSRGGRSEGLLRQCRPCACRSRSGRLRVPNPEHSTTWR